MKTSITKLAKDFVFIVVGCLCYAISLNVFKTPNNIVSGGIVGISQIINYLIDVPIGTMSFAINIPLFILGFMWLEKQSVLKTFATTFIYSACVDLTAGLLPAFTEDRLFAAIMSGVLAGIGGGIIFMRGTTAGGADLISQLIHHKKPDASMGTLMLLISGTSVVLGAFVFGDLNSAFYAITSLYVSSVTVDKILSGLDAAKLVFIISSRGEELADEITHRTVKGVTVIDAMGAYSHEGRKVLLCAVRRKEVHSLRVFVRKIDPTAFLVFTNASEVWGSGFKNKEII